MQKDGVGFQTWKPVSRHRFRASSDTKHCACTRSPGSAGIMRILRAPPLGTLQKDMISPSRNGGELMPARIHLSWPSIIHDDHRDIYRILTNHGTASPQPCCLSNSEFSEAGIALLLAIMSRGEK